MKFKGKFARIVNEAQLVECIIEATSIEEANEKFSTGDFKRFLIMKRDAREVTMAGSPEFEQIT